MEDGDHAQLLARGGLYAQLVSRQLAAAHMRRRRSDADRANRVNQDVRESC